MNNEQVTKLATFKGKNSEFREFIATRLGDYQLERIAAELDQHVADNNARNGFVVFVPSAREERKNV